MMRFPVFFTSSSLLFFSVVAAAAAAAASDSSIDSSSTKVKAHSIWLPGATGSGPFDVATAWAAAFGALYPEASITLSSVGSGAAQKALWGDIDCAEKPVRALCSTTYATANANANANANATETLWGLGDAPLPTTAYTDQPQLLLQQMPACGGAIAIVYSNEVSQNSNSLSNGDGNGTTNENGNEPNGNEPLRMTFEVLGGIFNASIVFWDDPRLQRLNPLIRLPHQRISKVVRQDSSGQTSIVTDALGYQLEAIEGSWPPEAVGQKPEWPLGPLAHPQDRESDSYCIDANANANADVNLNANLNTTSANPSINEKPYSFETDGKNGMSLGLIRIPYSIGYMEMGFFGRLTDFLAQVRMGTMGTMEDDDDNTTNTNTNTFIEATPDSLRATMAGLADQLDPETLELNLARATTPPGGFPIAGYAYWYLKKSPDAYTDCYQAWLLCQFVAWSYQDPQAAELALANGWVVPPEQVTNKTLDRLQDVMCYNTEDDPPTLMQALSYIPPPYRPVAALDQKQSMAIFISAVVAFVIMVGLLLWSWDRNRKRRQGDDNVWKIQKHELAFGDPPEVVGRGKFGQVLLAEYRGTQVAVKRVIPITASTVTVAGGKGGGSGIHTGLMTSSGTSGRFPSFLGNAELTAISGTSSGGGNLTLATEGHTYSSSGRSGSGVSKLFAGARLFSSSDGRSSSGGGGGRRTLTLKEMKYEFVKEMRFLSKLRHPCITTIMGGVLGDDPMLVMEYMHHGSLYDLLHNETLVLDGDLIIPMLRDTASGVRFLHTSTPQVIHGDLKSLNILVDDKFRAKVADFGLSQEGRYGTGTPYWMAPELLRGESINTTATDVFSYGIILYEVFSRRDPYEDDTDPREVIRLIADQSVRKRPPVPRNMPEGIKALMSDCLDDDPDKRPTYEELDTRLKRIDAEAANVAQPSSFGGQNAQLSLFDIFPRHIAEALQKGQAIEAEHKDCVTIFFCDIVGFTTISSELEPRKVAAMLDRLYTKFDRLSHEHELFKVETIGDAYMAVTNLVKDQPDDHAKRIADFAIQAIEAANSTYIDVEDHSKGCVNIRVGFHSGPVVADVVGTRNPRYCLFGDTVNTASRMESNSEANRINCSKSAAKLLNVQCPEMPMRSRGAINVKGKGEMTCYWVNEKGGRPAFPAEVHNPMVGLMPLVESSREFDGNSSVGDVSRASRRGSSKKKRMSWLPFRSSITGGTDRSEQSGGALSEGFASEKWHDEMMGTPAIDEEVDVFNDPIPEAPLSSQMTGQLAKLLGQSGRWLRLNDEVVYDDEISV